MRSGPLVISSRGTAPSAQGPPTRRPRGRLHRRTFPTARSCEALLTLCRRLAGAAHRREALPGTRPGGGDGARTTAASRFEARHHPAVALHDPGRGTRGHAIRPDLRPRRAHRRPEARARPGRDSERVRGHRESRPRTCRWSSSIPRGRTGERPACSRATTPAPRPSAQVSPISWLSDRRPQSGDRAYSLKPLA